MWQWNLGPLADDKNKPKRSIWSCSSSSMSDVVGIAVMSRKSVCMEQERSRMEKYLGKSNELKTSFTTANCLDCFIEFFLSVLYH